MKPSISQTRSPGISTKPRCEIDCSTTLCIGNCTHFLIPPSSAIPIRVERTRELIKPSLPSQHARRKFQTTIQKLTDRIIDYKIKRNIYDHNSLSAGHIVSIPLNNINVHALKERLQNNKVVVSFRGTSIRISPHVYNDVDDIDKLLYCLQG